MALTLAANAVKTGFRFAVAAIAAKESAIGLPPAATDDHSYRSSKKFKFKTYAVGSGLVNLEVGRLIQKCS